jgi:hypothetical protein
VPAIKPVTMPALVIVAIPPAAGLHTPPVVRSASPVVAPGHTDRVPVITNGIGLMVMVVCALQPVAVAV